MRLPICLTTFLLLGLTVQSLAQPKFKLYPDSIRVELPDFNGMVVFEMRNYAQSTDFVRIFSKTLGEALGNVKKSTGKPLAESEPLHIEMHIMPEGWKEVGIGTKPFGEKQLVSIRPMDPPQTTMTIIKDKGIVELLPPGWELHLISKDYNVKVYASTFAAMESIVSVDFGIVAEAMSADEGMKTLGRKSIESQFIVRNQRIDQRAVNYVHPGDQISLGIYGGVGLVQNILYPELSFKLALNFRDRFRRPNFRTSLIYDNLFFAQQTTDGFATNINGFLSAGFEKNFNRKTAQPSWSGLGIGFLVRNSGNYFTGNTAKFFITHSIPNSRFSVIPEFYLTDDFKKFTFGMTLKYSF